MSEWNVQVVRIGPVTKHPNADTLSVTQVYGGYPCIFKTGDFKEGDLAVYVPVDSIVPASDDRWKFFDGHNRIRAKKLRGVFSQGILMPANPKWKEGRNCAGDLGIVKYDPETSHERAVRPQRVCESSKAMPEYTDIEGLRKHLGVLVEGEDVIITCKLHGSNFRAAYTTPPRRGMAWWKRSLYYLGFTPKRELFMGSHHQVRKDHDNEWWNVALRLGLDEKLKKYPDLILFGESLGCFAKTGYKYDSDGTPGSSFRAFDIYDLKTKKYLDYNKFLEVCSDLDVEAAPILYWGPWSLAKAFSLAEGPDPINPKHIREGIVVRPAKERYEHCGRVIFKLKSEQFLLKDK